MNNEWVLKRLYQLLAHIQTTGGDTAELLLELPDPSDAAKQINDMDAHLSVWEDEVQILIDQLTDVIVTERGG